MPNHWLLKTEPRTYSFQQLERDGSTVWDGVRNPLALKHLRAMNAGDRVMIYHTGSEKAVVGLARVVRAAFPDPKAADERLVVVELAAGGPLPKPVALSTVKSEPALMDLALVRQGRLSVMPVSSAQWAVLLSMGGLSD